MVQPVSTWPRIIESLRWLAAEISCTPYEFRAAFQPDGDALLDGLKSRSMVIGDRERIGISEHGRRVLEAQEPVNG